MVLSACTSEVTDPIIQPIITLLAYRVKIRSAYSLFGNVILSIRDCTSEGPLHSADKLFQLEAAAGIAYAYH